MKIKIYCLYEPHTCKIRYIGRTKTSLKKRLSHHISVSKLNNSNSHKENWIRNLLKNGIKPKIRLLVELDTTWGESHQFEKCLIEKHFIKHNLVNGVDAGPGNLIKNINEYNEKLRIEAIKKHFSKEENKINFYNKIYCYDSDGNFFKEYKSSVFACKELNIKKTVLSNHINRFDNYNMNVNSINGYYFSKYKYDKINISLKYQSNHVGIKIYKDNVFIKTFKNMKEFIKFYKLTDWDIKQYRNNVLTKRMNKFLEVYSISPL